MKILAIDPGTKTGATFVDWQGYFKTYLWDNKPMTKTKKREGEPKHYRLLKLWRKLESLLDETEIDVVVCEGALGFQRGRSAVEASHKFRGTIELFCAQYNIKYIEISPNDLKRFALGKGTGDKEEMISAANKLGYEGNEDNEADSYLIAKWYLSTQDKLQEID